MTAPAPAFVTPTVKSSVKSASELTFSIDFWVALDSNGTKPVITGAGVAATATGAWITSMAVVDASTAASATSEYRPRRLRRPGLGVLDAG